MITFSGQVRRGVAVRWPHKQSVVSDNKRQFTTQAIKLFLQGRHRWNLSPIHIQNQEEDIPPPKDGEAYFDVSLVRTIPGRRSWAWSQALSWWRTAHNAAAGPATVGLGFTAAELDDLIKGPVAAPYFDERSWSSVQTTFLQSLQALPSATQAPPVRRASAELLKLLLRFVLPVMYHHTEVCTAAAQAGPCPAPTAPSAAAAALHAEGAPLPSAQQLVHGVHFLKQFLATAAHMLGEEWSEGDALRDALLRCVEQSTLALGLLASLDRPSKPKGKSKGKRAQTNQAQISSGAGAAASGDAPAPPSGQSAAPSSLPPASGEGHAAGIFPDIIARMACDEIGPSVIQMLKSIAQSLKALPPADIAAACARQAASDARWCEWTAESKGSEPQADSLGMYAPQSSTGGASATPGVPSGVVELLRLHRTLSVAAGRAAGTVLLSTPMSQSETAAAGWLSSATFSAGLSPQALQLAVRTMALAPSADALLGGDGPSMAAGIAACSQKVLTNRGVAAVTPSVVQALPKALQAFRSATCSSAELLKHGFLASEVAGVDLPAPSIALAHWLDAHLRRGSQAVLKNKTKAAIAAGVPLGNAFGTVHSEAECATMAVLLHHSGATEQACSAVKAWYSQFISITQDADAKDRLLLLQMADSTPAPNETFVALHKRFSEVRDSLRTLKTAEASGEFAAALKHVPKSSLPSTGGKSEQTPSESKEEEEAAAGMAESKTDDATRSGTAAGDQAAKAKRGGASRSPVAQGLNDSVAAGSTTAMHAVLPAHVRQLDAPFSLSLALEQLLARADLLLCLAPAATSAQGLVRQGSQQGWLAACEGSQVAELGLNVGHTPAESPNTAALDDALHGASAYLTHGQAAPPRAVLPWLVARSLRAGQKTSGFRMLNAALKAALGMGPGSSLDALAFDKASRNVTGLLLPGARDVLLPVPYVLGARSNDKLPVGSHFAQDVAGVSTKAAAELHASWATSMLACAKTLEIAKHHADSATFAAAARIWMRDLHMPDFELLNKSGMLSLLMETAGFHQQAPSCIGTWCNASIGSKGFTLQAASQPSSGPSDAHSGIGAQQADLLESAPAAAGAASEEPETRWELMDPSVVSAALQSQSMPPDRVARLIRLFADTPEGRSIGLNKLNSLVVTAMGRMPRPTAPTVSDTAEPEAVQAALAEHDRAVAAHAQREQEALARLGGDISGMGIVADHPLVKWWIDNNAFDGVGAIIAANNSPEALIAAYSTFAEHVNAIRGDSQPHVSEEDELQAAIRASMAMGETSDTATETVAAQPVSPAEAAPETQQHEGTTDTSLTDDSRLVFWAAPQIAQALLRVILTAALGCRRHPAASAFARIQMAAGTLPDAPALGAAHLVRSTSRASPLALAESGSAAASIGGPPSMGALDSGAITAKGLPANSAAALLLHSDAACKAVAAHLFSGEGVAATSASAFVADARAAQRQTMEWLMGQLSTTASQLHTMTFKRHSAPSYAADIVKQQDTVLACLQLLFALRDIGAVRSWMGMPEGLRCAWRLVRAGGLQLQQAAFLWLRWVIRETSPQQVDSALWSVLSEDSSIASPMEAEGYASGTLVAVFLLAIAGSASEVLRPGGSVQVGQDDASLRAGKLVGTFSVPAAEFGALQTATILLAASEPSPQAGGVFVPMGAFAGHTLQVLQGCATHLLRLICTSVRVVDDASGDVPPMPSVGSLPRQPSLGLKHSSSVAGGYLAFKDLAPIGSWAHVTLGCVRGALGCDVVQPLVEQLQHSAHVDASVPTAVSALGLTLGALNVLNGNTEVVAVGARVASPGMQAQAATAGATSTKALAERYSAFVVGYSCGQGVAEVMFPPTSGSWHPGNPVQRMVAPVLRALEADPLPSAACVNVLLGGDESSCEGEPSLSSTAWFDDSVLETLRSLLLLAAMAKVKTPVPTSEEDLSKATLAATAAGGAAAGSDAIRGLSSGAGAQRKSTQSHVVPGDATTLAHERAVVTGTAAPGIVDSSSASAAADALGSDGGASKDSGVSALSVLGVQDAHQVSFELCSNATAALMASLQSAAVQCLQVAIADDLKGLPLVTALFALALKVHESTKQNDARSLPIVRLLVALGVSAQPLASMVAPRHMREASSLAQAKLLEHIALGARAGSLLPLSDTDSGSKEDTPEVAARKAKAQELSSMGFDYDLVLKGLEIKADDPERVLDWILSGEAEAFKAGDGLKSGPADGEENPRYAAAQTLALTAAKPTKLCIRALELKADNPNAALNWLLDEGTAYLPGLSVGDGQEFEGHGAGSGMMSVMRQHLHGELADSAVLDDIGVSAGAVENLIPDEGGFTAGITHAADDSDGMSILSSESEYSYIPDISQGLRTRRRSIGSGSDSGSDGGTSDGGEVDEQLEELWIDWMNESPEQYERRTLILHIVNIACRSPSEVATALLHAAANLTRRFLAEESGLASESLGDHMVHETATRLLNFLSNSSFPQDHLRIIAEHMTALTREFDAEHDFADEFEGCNSLEGMVATLRSVYEGCSEDDPITPVELQAARGFLGSSEAMTAASLHSRDIGFAGSPPLSTPAQQQHMSSSAARSRGRSGSVSRTSLGGEATVPKAAADAAVLDSAASNVVHVARQPLASEYEAVFLPLPRAGTPGVTADDWRGCVVSFPFVKRQRLSIVAGAGDADYDDGSTTLKRQWRLTVLTGILLDDCSSSSSDMLRVAVLHEPSGLLNVCKIHRQRLHVHATVLGASPLSTADSSSSAALAEQVVAVQHACLRNAARGALLNLLLLSSSLFSTPPQASSPLLEGDAPGASTASLGPGPMRGVISRAELMRLVKLSAATEDTFGVHSQGEAAIAAGASIGADPGQYLAAGRGGAQVLPIGCPSVGAWLLLLQKWLDSEAVGSKQPEGELLTSSLTAEAARHIDLATNPGSAASGSGSNSAFLMRESLHPHYHSCETHDTLTFPGARALWVFFDSRSETHQNARLNFFAGLPSKTGGASVHSVGGHPKNFRPFVIHGDTVHLSFHASHSSSEACWGYRMYVAPMLGLAWTNEAQVATGAASLEWACYALEFLLGSFEAGESASSSSAVHSAAVFNSLVSYLRARGTPFKSRVVSLLTQLLKSPEAYPSGALPNMALLHGVEKAVFKYVEAELRRSEGKAFPAGLLQLIELLITARMAQRTMDAASSAAALESGATMTSLGKLSSSPPGLASVFLPQSVRSSLAAAAARGASSGAAVASGAGEPTSVSLTPAVRCAIRDIDSFDVDAAHPTAEGELNSRPLSDVLLETMDIIEAIHAQQLALLARDGQGSEDPVAVAAGSVLPLQPALLMQCVLTAGWATGQADVSADMLLSAAVSLGKWSTAADDQLVQWLTTITSPARRSLVADTKARLERENAGSTDAFDWDPCCCGTARSPLVLNAAQLHLLPAAEEGQQLMATSGKPVHASIPDDAIAFPALAESGISMPALRLRVALLQHLNRRLKRVLPLIDVVRASTASDQDGGSKPGDSGGKSASNGANLSFSLGHKLRALSHCVFIDVKRQVLDGCIAATWTGENGSGFSVTLDNKAAFKHMEAAAQDTSLRCPDKAHCIAAQLYKALTKEAAGRAGKAGAEGDGAAVGAAMARGMRSKNDHKESLWKVNYKGEDGMDWGGLYRDCFSRVVDDLFSDRMDVFVPTPNNIAAAGQFQDKWLPNPSNTTPSALAFYTFVGRLIGVTLRHTMQLPFDLAPAVWARVLSAGDADKAATSSKRRRRRTVDTASSLWQLHDDQLSQRLRDLEGMTYEQFVAAHAADVVSLGAPADSVAEEDVQPLFFVSTASDGSQVELCPGGDERRVLTKSDVHEYIALTMDLREHEFDAQCAAIRGGLVSIIPPRALQLLTWREMELLVCGDPVVDVQLLKKHTQYDSYEESSEGVARFWRCFETLSNEERGKFIRFSWGRSRLPEPGQFSRKFRLSKRGGNDGSLPVAHACFWQVEWPEYSTDEIALQRMRIAINYGMSGEFLIA